MKNLVYLAGPITGLTFGSATQWRDEVKASVLPHIATLSPLRGKQYLEARSNQDGMIVDSYEQWPLSSAKGINSRDHWDCTRADVVFVNLLGAEKVSIGTVMEIAWAFTHQVPVILCMEKCNPHNHAMIRESSNFIVESLKEGIEVLNAILSNDEQLELAALPKKACVEPVKTKFIQTELFPAPIPAYQLSAKEGEPSPLDLFKDAGETNAEEILKQWESHTVSDLAADYFEKKEIISK